MDTSAFQQHGQSGRKPAGKAREKRTMSFQELTRGFSHFTLRTSLRRKSAERTGITGSQALTLTKTLAASDGELNVMEADEQGGGSHCSSSNSSLPSVANDRASGVDQTASWAVSFERLLEDPTGVRYFTAFLKSEVSAENILFWKACEKFRRIPVTQPDELCREALSIYNTYLSDSATLPVNIDDTARVNEQILRAPQPNMFQKAQQQIFKLMKFDSYARFVRSQLYQSCMRANVEGRPLPDIGPRSKAPAAKKSAAPESSSLRDQQKPEPKQKEKSKAKAGRSAAADAEEERRKVPVQKWEKRQEKTAPWGDSPTTVKTGGLSRNEMERLGAQLMESERTVARMADKYCCVYLPDGTASLMPARPGFTVRNMLMGLCEKRGLPLRDISIYMQGKDKKPLSLDQDSSVLKDQQVVLEIRVTLAVKIAFMGKTVTIVAKSNKTLQDALSTILQKYNLRPHEAIVTMSESSEILNMNMTVMSLANQTVILDRAKDDIPGSTTKVSVSSPGLQMRRGGIADVDISSSGVRGNARQRNPGLRRTYDMDGLVELLNRAQWCSADDQRGLLSKEHLMLPQFLQQPLPEETDEGTGERDRLAEESKAGSSSCPPEMAGTMPSLPPTGLEVPGKAMPTDGLPDSQSSGPARETVV
ncbi:regulator of G-protein signaling 14 isoform X2 [Clupea harengus]|uniref:Regulator of G-protein signaling 14 isoform X2 n=1 Tax=Clupea harengus TaxID=7950 RepID=A0A6P8FVL1_CLUHA|nr:regulator of G-protein signaling 14 isoform X2 [Clupea harengus]